jgi:chloramphenicol 3-O-phosphotransferase
VLLLTGAPGAGKTSVARALASHYERAVHVEADEFFRFVASGWVDPAKPGSQHQNETVMRSVALAAASYADGGYVTIVEGIIQPRWFLEPLRDRLGAAGHRTAYAILHAPLATCIERARARSAQPLADAAVVQQLWDAFAQPAGLERHVVDASVATAEAVAATIAHSMEELELSPP